METGYVKTAIVTGPYGMDGSYLTELLLGYGHKVVGISRRSARDNDHTLSFCNDKNYIDETCDITDASGIRNIVNEHQPDFFFNLAAQSHVGQSFKEPQATLMSNGYAVAGMLEVLRNDKPDCRFYQASTSEQFGNNGEETPFALVAPAQENGFKTEITGLVQSLDTPFSPRSPYAAAKLYAHSMVKIYREAYGMFACSGILFNHEGERRALDFVTRKITYNVARIKLGLQETIKMGNLDSYRDYGYSPDYVRAMYMILCADEPKDYIVSTGYAVQIKEVLRYVCDLAGLDWEKVYEKDERFMRPAEVNCLCGDSSTIRRELGWKPLVTWKEMLEKMYLYDLEMLQKSENLVHTS